MKLLLDAQLPRRLSYRIREAGYDCLHTLDLPEGIRTQDSAIITIADQSERVVVTKDADFVSELLLHRLPKKLLLISTGNISNHELESLVLANLSSLAEAFLTSIFIEITCTGIVVHF